MAELELQRITAYEKCKQKINRKMCKTYQKIKN